MTDWTLRYHLCSLNWSGLDSRFDLVSNEPVQPERSKVKTRWPRRGTLWPAVGPRARASWAITRLFDARNKMISQSLINRPDQLTDWGTADMDVSRTPAGTSGRGLWCSAVCTWTQWRGAVCLWGGLLRRPRLHRLGLSDWRAGWQIGSSCCGFDFSNFLIIFTTSASCSFSCCFI